MNSFISRAHRIQETLESIKANDENHFLLRGQFTQIDTVLPKTVMKVAK